MASLDSEEVGCLWEGFALVPAFKYAVPLHVGGPAEKEV